MTEVTSAGVATVTPEQAAAMPGPPISLPVMPAPAVEPQPAPQVIEVTPQGAPPAAPASAPAAARPPAPAAPAAPAQPAQVDTPAAPAETPSREQAMIYGDPRPEPGAAEAAVERRYYARQGAAVAPPPPVAPMSGEDVLARIMGNESAGRVDARNPFPGQSAAGLFQITDGTFNAYALRLGLRPDQRMDPIAQRRIAEEIQADGRRAVGRPLTPGEAYGAHFLGVAGLRRFVFADPNADAYETYRLATRGNIADQAFASNPGLLERGMTVGEVMQRLEDRMAGRRPANLDLAGRAPAAGAMPQPRPSILGGAIRDVAQGAIDIGIEVSQMIGMVDRDIRLNLPDVRGGPVNDIMRGLVAFAIPFGGAMRAFRAAGLGRGAATALAAGAAADAMQDPQNGNLSSLAEELGFGNELTRFLAAKPAEEAPAEDQLRARLMTMIEGGMAGVAIDGIVAMARASRRGARGAARPKEGDEAKPAGKRGPQEARATGRPHDELAPLEPVDPARWTGRLPRERETARMPDVGKGEDMQGGRTPVITPRRPSEAAPAREADI
jgi:hypothetical protein